MIDVPLVAGIRLSVLLAAGMALAGALGPPRVRRWSVFWPLPMMALAAAVGAVDLGGLAGIWNVGLPAPLLTLGVWAATTVNVVGVAEIRASRARSGAEWALLAPALLMAAGLTLLLARATTPGLAASPPPLLAGVSVLLAGALLLGARLSPRRRTAVLVAWPTLLALAAVGDLVAPGPPPDRFAVARGEVAGLVAAWTSAGLNVVAAESTAVGRPPRVSLMQRYMVGGHDVRVYLVTQANGSHAGRDPWPDVPAPLVTLGVPHLHRGRHIVVVCLTDDLGFARYLDRLVHRMMDPPPRDAAA